MKNKFFIKSWLLALVLLASSCEQILEINPRQSVDANTALDTREGINAAVVGVYATLKSVNLYGRNLFAIAECLADNTTIINRAGGRFVNEGSNVQNAHLGGWGTYYGAINNCNLILEAIPTAAISEAERTALEGEVKFLRALLYFDLSRVFTYEPKRAQVLADLNRGGVPLLLKGTINPSQITYPARATVDEVYAQIYADLTDAIAKAPTTGAPARATRLTARALFSRVALYNEDWANAVTSASDVINAGTPALVNNASYVSAWRSRNHPEAIFEVAFVNQNESLGVNDALQSAYTTRVDLLASTLGGWGAVTPTNAYLTLLTPAAPTVDVRRALYQPGVNRANVITTECTKFLGKTGTVYMDNIPVLRVSEMFLNRAEANFRLGNETAALADVNVIRTRCGLPAAVGLTGVNLLNEIVLQRRLEFGFEGHRWFDLKRWGFDVIKSTGNVLATDFRLLAPLPLGEIQANPNLVQNVGY